MNVGMLCHTKSLHQKLVKQGCNHQSTATSWHGMTCVRIEKRVDFMLRFHRFDTCSLNPVHFCVDYIEMPVSLCLSGLRAPNKTLCILMSKNRSTRCYLRLSKCNCRWHVRDCCDTASLVWVCWTKAIAYCVFAGSTRVCSIPFIRCGQRRWNDCSNQLRESRRWHCAF